MHLTTHPRVNAQRPLKAEEYNSRRRRRRTWNKLTCLLTNRACADPDNGLPFNNRKIQVFTAVDLK